MTPEQKERYDEIRSRFLHRLSEQELQCIVDRTSNKFYWSIYEVEAIRRKMVKTSGWCYNLDFLIWKYK